MKWMLSSDYHFPHNDQRATDLWFQVMEYFQPDAIDYIGDIDDCSQYSRWTEGRPSEFLQKYKKKDSDDIAAQIWLDAEPARRFYEKTRQVMPDADIHVCLGNHDSRITEYVEKKLPDLIDTVTEDFVWEFSRQNITFDKYSAKPRRRFGSLHVHHGQAISKHAGESVKSDVDSWGVSLVRGHSHRQGYMARTYDMRDETLVGYELGHMTDVKSPGMEYTNIHNWQHGFGYAYVEDGHVHMNLVHIKPDYSCFIDGKRFQA